MNIYIAGHSQEEARRVAEKLTDAGHKITSTWLAEVFKPTRNYTEADRVAIANQDVDDICHSRALVLISSPTRVPGGKFVEVGVAIGCDIPVYVLGHRENMLMWHSNVQAFDSVEDLITSGVLML